MISRTQKQAARAYRRLLAQRTDGWDEAEAVDAHWDGGEFSGPAWADNWLTAECVAISETAAQFGLTDDQLCDAIEWMDSQEAQRFYDSVIG